jgi:hypothetical protein
MEIGYTDGSVSQIRPRAADYNLVRFPFPSSFWRKG